MTALTTSPSLEVGQRIRGRNIGRDTRTWWQRHAPLWLGGELEIVAVATGDANFLHEVSGRRFWRPAEMGDVVRVRHCLYVEPPGSVGIVVRVAGPRCAVAALTPPCNIYNQRFGWLPAGRGAVWIRTDHLEVLD